MVNSLFQKCKEDEEELLRLQKEVRSARKRLRQAEIQEINE
jgi:hypothetical protein